MLVEKAEIHHYIPQKAPMVMVDQLLNSDEKKTTSNLTISAENIFCTEGCFTEPGIIENMAQTAALHAGYEAKSKHEKVKVGFIGAVKKLNINKLPKVNSTIETIITIINNFGNILIVKGEVNLDGELMAKCEMSIFTQEENVKNES